LTHMSSRYASDASRLGDEARSVFDGEVSVAYDGYEFSVPFTEE
jgi:ribonuclease Z